MKYSGKIFPLDRFIIAAVRKRREELAMTQEDVSLELNPSSSDTSSCDIASSSLLFRTAAMINLSKGKTLPLYFIYRKFEA